MLIVCGRTQDGDSPALHLFLAVYVLVRYHIIIRSVGQRSGAVFVASVPFEVIGSFDFFL